MAAQPMTSPQPDRVPFEAAAPRVTLRNHFAHPYDSAIAAARTCYAPRLIGPEEITDKQRLQIGASTFYGGHHTVYQHAHFEFGLENVSRQFVWSFLHAHPFYNSEQQSQRYVRLDHALAYLPPEMPGFGAAERAIYEDAIARAWGYYRELTALLQGDAREILSDIWHIGPMSHPKRVQKVDRQAEKRAIEVARYVLPVAAATTMVHTLSGIVLHRLWRMAAASDTPTEARAVIGEMVARVREIDPQFFDRFDNAPDGAGRNAGVVACQLRGCSLAVQGEDFAREFDARLAGRVSLLTDYSPQAPRVVAEAYRAVLGLTESACSDEEALDRLLNPARNAYRLETLNIGVHAPIMRALQHANFTFAKKISHTADSQDQRHRMVPGSRPLLMLTDTRSPDFVRPCSSPETRAPAKSTNAPWPTRGRRKTNCSTAACRAKSRCTCCRTPKPFAWSSPARCCTCCTNGPCAPASTRRRRFTRRRWKRSSKSAPRFPSLGRYLGPPCYIRAGIATPICTEGSHFCGVKVWQEFPKIERRI